MLDFHVIEGRISEWMKRQSSKRANQLSKARTTSRGQIRSTSTPLKDL